MTTKEIKTISPPIKNMTTPRFILLSITTLYLYQIIWLYRIWKWLKKELEINISPLARVLFFPFFLHSLTKHLDTALVKQNKPKKFTLPVKTKVVGGFFFLWTISIYLSFVDNVYGQFIKFIIDWLFFIPLLPVLKGINTLQTNKKKYTCKDFTWWQFILIILMILILFFFYFVLPFMIEFEIL